MAVRSLTAEHASDARTGAYAPIKGKTTGIRVGAVGGHRGATSDYPENTMEGFRAAVAAGVDMLVLPVRVLADGVPVIMHDSTWDRTTSFAPNTPTDTGQTVEGTTSAKAAQIFVQGSKTIAGMGFPDGSYRVPFLRQVLAEFGGHIPLWFELKTSTAFGRAALLSDLAAFPVAGTVTIQSFVWADLTAAVAAGYDAQFISDTADLTAGGAPGTASLVLAAGVKSISGGFAGNASDGTITALLAAGLKVYCYLPPTSRRIDRDHYLGLGCQGVIADAPLYMLGKSITPAPYSSKSTWPGQLGGDTTTNYRGEYIDPGSGGAVRWGIGTGSANTDQTVLQPDTPPDPTNYTLTDTVTYDNVTTGSSVVCFGCVDDAGIKPGTNPANGETNGYWLRMRPARSSDGQFEAVLFQRNRGAADVQIGSAVTGAGLTTGATVTSAKAVTSGGITATLSGGRTGSISSAGAAAKAYRGPYIHRGRAGLNTQQCSWTPGVFS